MEPQVHLAETQRGHGLARTTGPSCFRHSWTGGWDDLVCSRSLSPFSVLSPRPPCSFCPPSPPHCPWDGRVLRQPLSEGGKMATSSVSPAQRGHHFPHHICQSLGPGSQQPPMGYEPSLDLPLCLLRPRPGPQALSGDDQ